MTDDTPASPFNTGGALDALSGLGQEQQDALVGRTLGEYRVAELVGQGGMSTVYRAERIDGSFDRAVAIKVSFLSGMDEQAHERFVAEQRILAGLNHPNMSQLFDAGVTAEGWPYIVMELVDGVDIVAYCKTHDLALRERINLLRRVIDAASHAHSRLILHRDIKPSNVLVDREGQPKLLDFGIAKPLNADSAAQTQGTMTPRYASPEQVLGEATGVGSDVYQLGLLMLEVLTGERLHTEDDPLSLRRHLSAGTSIRLPADVRRSLPLECVAMIEQCLRLDSDERYRDATALGEDLVAYLSGYPVKAVGQSLAYRTKKYVIRNRAAVGLTSAAVIALICVTIWYLYALTGERNFAQQQQALAEQSLEFMSSFFRASNPVTTAGQELTASQILQMGAERVEAELADQPEIQQRLYSEIAESFYHRERLPEAERYLRKTFELDEILGADKDNVLSDYNLRQNLLASILSDRGDYQSAWQISKRIFDMAQTSLGPTHERTLKAQGNLAITAKRLGNLDESRRLLEDVHQKNLQLHGPLAQSTVVSALNLVSTYGGMGLIREAHDLAQRSLPDAERGLGVEHPVTLYLLGNLSQTTLDIEGPEAAIPVKRDLLARGAKVYGADSFYYQGHLAHLGAMLGRTGRLAEAEQAQLQAIAQMTKLRGEHVPEVLIARSNLLSTWIDMGKFEQAQQELDTLLPMFMSRAGPEDGNVVYCRTMQLKIYTETNHPATRGYADQLYSDLVEMFGPEDERAREVQSVLSQMAPAA